MKILIIKTSALGDILHCLPILSYLKDKFKHCHIDWVVEKGGSALISAHPHINSTLVIDTKKWRKSLFSRSTRHEIGEFRRSLRQVSYDFAIDLQGNCKSALVLLQTKARVKAGFGWKSVPEWPNALFTSSKFNPPPGRNIRQDYLVLVKSIFHDVGAFEEEEILLTLKPEESQQFAELMELMPKNPLFLVASGSNWENKQLPLETLVKFLKKIEGTLLFSWGNEAEKETALKLSRIFPNSRVLPILSLPLLQHVMKRCAKVISMDSLPLHLAAVAGVPTFSFFGPSSAKKYAPSGPKHVVFQGQCPYGMTFEKRCPKLRSCATGACLKDGSVAEKLTNIGFKPIR